MEARKTFLLPTGGPIVTMNKINVNTIELRKKFTDYHNYYSTKSAFLGDTQSNYDLTSLASSSDDLNALHSMSVGGGASQSRVVSIDEPQLLLVREKTSMNLYNNDSHKNYNRCKDGDKDENREDGRRGDNNKTSNLSKRIQMNQNHLPIADDSNISNKDDKIDADFNKGSHKKDSQLELNWVTNYVLLK